MVRGARPWLGVEFAMKGTNTWHHRRGDVGGGNAYLRAIVGRVSEVGKVEVQSMIGDENKQETGRLTEVRA